MDWCCCRVSANVDRSSLVIDMNYTRSHVRCPHTRSILGPVYLINLNSVLSSSHVGTVRTVTLKKGKPIAHDSKSPQEEKKTSFHSISVKMRIAQGAVIWYMGIHRAHTWTQMHHSSSKTPATHRRESHPCHVYVRVCSTDSGVQYVWLTGCERSTGAEPYLVATMPSQGPEQETLERGGNSQGMLNISWVRRHSAWWYKHVRCKRQAH